MRYWSGTQKMNRYGLGVEAALHTVSRDSNSTRSV